jgi:predicted peptidase
MIYASSNPRPAYFKRGTTMRKTILILFPVLLCIASATAAAADKPRQSAAKLEKQIPVELDYLIYLPDDYEKKEAWPLVVFLHGAGERGDDLDRVKIHGPPKLIEQGKSFPAIVVSPQCAAGRWWQSQVLELTTLIDEIVDKYKVDEDRIYLTGLSMGGFGTWALAAYTPDRFAAIMPICGGGEPLMARTLKNVPVWVFHGAKDPIVPVARAETMVEVLKRAKGNVKFTVYPDALHDSWTATYDNPEVWEWLFAQKRQTKEGS